MRAATEAVVFEDADCNYGNLGPFSAPSVLDQTSKDVARLREDQTLVSSRKNTLNKLQEMSTRYVSSAFKDNNIWSEMKRHRQATDSFYIPAEAPKVQEFTQILLEHLDSGYPVFVRPPRDLIPKILSEPQNVLEKAWVVMTNCILTSAIANEESPCRTHRCAIACNGMSSLHLTMLRSFCILV